MSKEFKRTIHFYKGTSKNMEQLPSGEKVYHRDTLRHEVPMLICGMELSAVTFHYTPTYEEVMYAMSRIRNPKYMGGHEPDDEAPVVIWKSASGRCWVRIGEECLLAFASTPYTLIEEYEKRRDHCIQWIKSRLL